MALLADLIHNVGDALTAVPLGIAFFLRSARGEKFSGLFVVFAIFVSACVALYESIERLFNPQDLTHLWLLAAAGVIGFLGNEIAAQVRLRAGWRVSSPALIADGNHARVDGYVSLGVVASAAVVALGVEAADPIIGLLITLVILKVTWDSWRTVRASEPGEPLPLDRWALGSPRRAPPVFRASCAFPRPGQAGERPAGRYSRRRTEHGAQLGRVRLRGPYAKGRKA